MIECINFKKFESGSLRGFADLFIPKWGIEIRGCSFCEKNGARWINLPAKEFVTDKGEKRFLPYIKFRNQKHFEAFSTQAKKAIDTYIESQSEQNLEEIFE